MCTVSWLVENNGYHLLFNRDEQRTRSLALLPKIHLQDGCEVIMPIDPDGQGSWIASNQFGLSVCLLNYYQGIAPPAPLISRGLLLKRLSSSRKPTELMGQLLALSLSSYAPFSLLVLGYDATKVLEVSMWVWDGKTLKQTTPSSPFTSSSVEFELVSSKRMALAGVMPLQPALSDLINYHQSHLPEKDFLSVCMHRSDAKSVSYSQISVSQHGVDFQYKNGSPCSDAMMSHVRMECR